MYRRFAERHAKPLVCIALLVALLQLGQARRGLAAGRKPEQDPEEAAGCHLRELELCAVGALSIFQNPNGLPASQLELKRQCDYLNESVQCFDAYGERCLTKLQWPLVQLFTDDLVELARQFCSADSELRQNYTKHVQCYREIQRQYQRPCLLDLQVGFEAVHKLNRSQRAATACCNINRLKECLFARIEDECGEPAMDTVGQIIERLTGGFFAITCRNYDPFDEACLRLLPKVGAKPHTGRNVSAISRIIAGFTNIPSRA